MRTVRVILNARRLTLLEAADLPENTPLTLALVETDGVPPDGIVRATQTDEAFAFLSDPREGLYSQSDGEAVWE